MTSPLKALPLDPFWESAVDFQSHADFEAFAESIWLRPEVPAPVAGRFDVVRRLVLHSAVEATLLEAAYDRTLLTVELAFKTRYDELVGSTGKRKRMVDYERWALENHLVEDGDLAEDGETPLQGLRLLRNTLSAHPSGTTRLGPGGLSLLSGIPRIINELYDDPELRRARNEERAAVNAALPGRAGAVADLTALGLGAILAFRSEVLYVENGGGAFLYVVAVWPLVEVREGDTSLNLSEPVLFTATGWEAEANGVRFGLASGESVAVCLATSPEAASEFERWERTVEKTSFGMTMLHSLASHQLARLRLALRTSQRWLPVLPESGTAT